MLDCASLTTTSKYHQPQDEVLIGINFGLPKPQDAKVRMESALCICYVLGRTEDNMSIIPHRCSRNPKGLARMLCLQISHA